MDEYYKTQPTINIGTIGHVAHGKTTFVNTLTTIDTRRYAKEKETNKTIRLGYANAMIYKCPICPAPQCYQSGPTTENEFRCKICDNIAELKKHVSFVDSPGHNSLMATLLNCTSLMHSAFLIASADDRTVTKEKKEILAPQTIEHLIAADIVGLDVCVCFTKIDLVKRERAMKRLDMLKQFMIGSKNEHACTIPISANFGINMDIVCQYIVECIKEPEKDLESDAEMIIGRSFNINKKNIPVNEMHGGVVGGSLIKGKLCINDEVTIVPGFVVKNPKNSSAYIYQPIKTRIVEIESGSLQLSEVIPGGLVSAKLTIDPHFTVQDKLVGNMVLVGDISRYKVFEKFVIKYTAIRQINENGEEVTVSLNLDDTLIINCNAKNVICKVISFKKKIMELESTTEPICVEIDGKITLSKQADSSGPRLIGYGRVKSGHESLMM